MRERIPAAVAVMLVVGVATTVGAGGPSPEPGPVAPPGQGRTLDVRIVADQAEAVLTILDARSTEDGPTSEDWERLFESEGYERLARRQAAFGRPIDQAEFRAFVLSDSLADRAESLRATLADWTLIDPTVVARRALTYLPEAARIRTTIYPVIKPTSNSFVFETDVDPAIILYLDPDVSRAEYLSTLVHELHHIGYGTGCPEPADGPAGRVGTVVAWLGRFAEGLAVLAAAGGPDTHPHATSAPDRREVWDRSLARFNADVLEMEAFFRDILEGELDDEDEIRRRGFEFVNTDDRPQGAFYTVGWRMGALVERHLGRPAVIRATCDERHLLLAYNRVARELNRDAAEPLVLWSDAFLEMIGARN